MNFEVLQHGLLLRLIDLCDIATRQVVAHRCICVLTWVCQVRLGRLLPTVEGSHLRFIGLIHASLELLHG